MKLQVDWDNFKKQLESFIEQGKDLHEENKHINGYFGRTMPRVSVKWCHIQKSYKDSISIDF